ncbi:MAG: Rieske (2Fe-2S) protein [Mastigocoleus sp.]
MNWIKAISVDAIAPGGKKVVDLGDRKILLVNHSGEIFATQNRCSHMNLSLKRGKITDDGGIVCPFHHSIFDLRNGEVKEWCTFPPVIGSMMGKMKQQQPLTVFPTRIENGDIMVGLES